MNVERAHLEGVMRELGDLLGLQPHEARKLVIKNTTLVRDCILTMLRYELQGKDPMAIYN